MDNRIFIAMNILEIKESLDFVMEKAGGAPLNAKQLSRISALELLDLLSTNNIRFCYIKSIEGKGN